MRVKKQKKMSLELDNLTNNSNGKSINDTETAAGMLQAREAALDILYNVLEKSRPLDQVLESHKGFLSVSTRDRAFVRMLTTTTIRRLGQIDDLIRRALSKPDQVISPPMLLYILRIGVAQLAFMNTPDHAAVNTSVELTQHHNMSKKKAFVNGVLRTIAREGKNWTTRQDVPRLNTPEWILKQWIADYTLRGAIDIGEANMSEGPLDVSVRDKERLEHWADLLKASVLPTGTLRCLEKGGLIQEKEGFKDGMWWVQDASAALPVKLFGDVSGKFVLDLCAAPGGKTMQLAAAGADVLALDRSPNRAKKIEENLKRLRLENNVRVEIADASVWSPKEALEYIILDAPCSATGTLRRHPDVVWTKTEKDMWALVDIQARLLNNAVGMLAPGGTLIYCTCSLQKEEGERQIERLLQDNSDIKRKPVSYEEVGHIKAFVNENGDVRVLPYHLAAHGGMDGFFISRLIRV